MGFLSIFRLTATGRSWFFRGFMRGDYLSIGSRLIFMGSILLALSCAVLAANTITGTVYDNRHNPLTDADVELLNDLGVFVQHSRTDTAGRYAFSGLADGRFAVRVMPFRYDFQEATREVTFRTFKVSASVRGSAIELLDFTLSPRKAGLAYSEAQVIFAQEIPDNARKALQKAEASIKKDLAGSIVALEEAIAIFPTYFSALYQLGEISFARQDYGKSAHYFLRAADINNKSPKSLYMLGHSLQMLKIYISADVALNQALTLSPASGEILLLLGTTQMKAGKFVEAEKHLKQAKRITTIPNPEVYWLLSQLYGNHLKNYAEAADELENYLNAQVNIDTPEQKKKAEDYKKLIKQLRVKATLSIRP